MNKDNVEADFTTRDISTRDRAIADLTGADMTGADMTGADMTGADMNGAGTTLRTGKVGDNEVPLVAARRLWGRRLRAALASPSLRRLLGRKLVPSVLVGAAVFSYAPAVAQAGTLSETMTLSSNVFPSGARSPVACRAPWPYPEGSSVKLTAPQYLYQPSVPPGSIGTVYEFMFWDVNSTLANTGTAKFTAPSSGAAFKASAWYLPVCVVSSSCSNGGTSAVSTWAFSLTTDQGPAGDADQLGQPGLRVDFAQYVRFDGHPCEHRRLRVPRASFEVLGHGVQFVVRVRRRRGYRQRPRPQRAGR